MEKIIVTLWITFGIYVMVLLAIMQDLRSGVRKAKKKLTEITRQEILNQVEKELIEIGKTVRDYKLGTVANFSSAILDTARNIAEKVGYLAQL